MKKVSDRQMSEALKTSKGLKIFTVFIRKTALETLKTTFPDGIINNEFEWKGVKCNWF